MYCPSKAFLGNLVIVSIMLFPIGLAASDDIAENVTRLQNRIQELQTRLTNANTQMMLLQAAVNTANQNISALQNSAAIKFKSDSTVRRTANGHGR